MDLFLSPREITNGAKRFAEEEEQARKVIDDHLARQSCKSFDWLLENRGSFQYGTLTYLQIIQHDEVLTTVMIAMKEAFENMLATHIREGRTGTHMPGERLYACQPNPFEQSAFYDYTVHVKSIRADLYRAFEWASRPKEDGQEIR